MTGTQVSMPRPSTPGGPPGPVTSPELDAVLFDMDGVITDTATVHALAWKRLFDDFLAARASEDDTTARPGADRSWARPSMRRSSTAPRR